MMPTHAVLSRRVLLQNGLAGGRAYRDAHKADLANHVMIMESDGGIFDQIYTLK